jgi:hypothetical protein
MKLQKPNKKFDILKEVEKLDAATEEITDKKWKKYFEKRDKEEWKEMIEKTSIEDAKTILLWEKNLTHSNKKAIEEKIGKYLKPEKIKKRIMINLKKRKREEAERAFSDPEFVKRLKEVFEK